MKRLLLVLVATLASFAAAAVPQAKFGVLFAGEPVPDFTVMGADGTASMPHAEDMVVLALP